MLAPNVIAVEQLPLLRDAVAPATAVEPIVVGDHRIRVGTCGYSYRDWLGRFYPERLPSREMLGFYARHFGVVEIDSSYYRVPTVATCASLARRTPDGFIFTAKAPGSLTHVPADVDAPSLEDAGPFREALQPLATEGKLGPVLLQFPNAFRPTARAERHLERLADALGGLALVAEFRHRDWQGPATLDLLARLGIGWCNVDEPRFESLLHPSGDVVGDVAYVRFHGRNAKMWWKGDASERYEYAYAAEELEPWTARVGDMASAARETYGKKLSFPDYYRPSFSADELAQIVAATGDVARRFGYDVAAIAQRVAAPSPEPTSISS